MEGRASSADTPDQRGSTPLRITAQRGHVDVAKLLIREGRATSMETPDNDAVFGLPLSSAIALPPDTIAVS